MNNVNSWNQWALIFTCIANKLIRFEYLVFYLLSVKYIKSKILATWDVN